MIREVRQLLDEKKYAQLRDLLCSKEPADIAQLFEQFPKEELPLMFRILQKDFATDVFVEMDTELQKALIEAFTDKELFEVFDDLFMDDTVDIIEEMPANVCPIFVSKIPKEGERRYEMLEKVSMGQALKSIPAPGQGGNGSLGETCISRGVS